MNNWHMMCHRSWPVPYLKESNVEDGASCQALQDCHRQEVAARVSRKILRHKNPKRHPQGRDQSEDHHIDDHKARRRATR